jgi:hypothetical protein
VTLRIAPQPPPKNKVKPSEPCGKKAAYEQAPHNRARLRTGPDTRSPASRQFHRFGFLQLTGCRTWPDLWAGKEQEVNELALGLEPPAPFAAELRDRWGLRWCASMTARRRSRSRPTCDGEKFKRPSSCSAKGTKRRMSHSTPSLSFGERILIMRTG